LTLIKNLFKMQALTQSDIISLHTKGNAETKSFLEEKYGKEIFSNPFGSINSLEDACKMNGTDLADAIPFPNPKNDKQRCINAFAAKIEIVQAANGGKIPDWKNDNQRKYRPWYWMNGSSGSGLSLLGVGYGPSDTYVASRLHFLTREHAEKFYEKFPQIEEDLMTQKSN